MTDFVPLLAFAALVVTVGQFIKYLGDRDFVSARNQAGAWLAGIAVTLLAANTDFASGIPVGDLTLDSLNLVSQIFVGFTVAGTAGVTFKALTPRGTTAGDTIE